MATMNPDAERQCREHLARFFESCGDPILKRSSPKALRFAAALDEPLTGKPEGRAAGIAYAVANGGCRPCGVPGLLNAELEQLFGVSMRTVRKRTAQIGRRLEV